MTILGAHHPNPGDGAPDGARTIVLVGNYGPAMWRAFSAARGAMPDNAPLDSWTRSILTGVARGLDADVVFPFDGPPYPPILSWAMRSGWVYETPIGPLIHREYGTWHGYRAALLFTDKLPLTRRKTGRSPCDDCTDRPCLSTCPVSAFSFDDGRRNYDVPACVKHLQNPDGLDCRTRGCLARRACPIGQDYIYEPDQAQFHMDWFVAACRALT